MDVDGCFAFVVANVDGVVVIAIVFAVIVAPVALTLVNGKSVCCDGIFLTGHCADRCGCGLGCRCRCGCLFEHGCGCFGGSRCRGFLKDGSRCFFENRCRSFCRFF